MARVFTDGAEMYDALFFSNADGVTASAVQKASGSYSYSFTGGSYEPFKTISSISECYFRERIRILATNTSDTSRFVSFRSSTNELAYVNLDALYRWRAVVGGATVGTALEVAVTATWYCLEVYYYIDGTNGRFVVRVDGNEIIDYTGDTLVGAYTTLDNIWWRNSTNTTFANFEYIDDLALNDTTGGSDNSWVGPARIIKITPDGNGTTTEWTGSDGNDTDNYLLVDEYPSDGDTTYVYEDATATGDLDQYTMSDYDGTDRVITRIYAECRARKTTADAATLKIGFDTGVSVNTDDVGTLYETYSVRLVGAEYTTNPDDAGTWEEADIDALEFVAEVG